MKKLTLSLILCAAILIPVATAQAKLTPDCGGYVDQTDPATGKPLPAVNGKVPQVIKVCDFTDAITLVEKIIHFLLIDVVAPFVALILCYAGFLLLTSGGSSEARSKAKRIILHVIVGYVIALAAWLIIHTILTTIGVDKCLDWLGAQIPDCTT